MNPKSNVISDTEVNENLTYKIRLSEDEMMLYVNVEYQKGKFSVEKVFKNNTFDLEKMEIFINKINTTEKIRDYLNLGEANEI